MPSLPAPSHGLGTLLRHLLELLDGDVQHMYDELQIEYRPRYTPIVRALLTAEPRTIRNIAEEIGMTHSAVSQSVAQMKKQGLVRVLSGTSDARERNVHLTAKCRAKLPVLEQQWAATEAAADALDSELTVSLRTGVTEAIAHLERRPFRERIRAHARVRGRGGKR
jgi:DNA-binding MarR family transcriptional regulator